MLPFKELKDYAKKIDDGINYLERSVQEPFQSYVFTEQSCLRANKLIETIKSDVKSIMDPVQEFINNEDENIMKNAETVLFADNVIGEINNTFSEMEDYLLEYGIGPIQIEEKDSVSNGSNIETSYRASSNDPANQDFLLETPSFKSPNYNSTPESHCNSKSTNGTSSTYNSVHRGFVLPVNSCVTPYAIHPTNGH